MPRFSYRLDLGPVIYSARAPLDSSYLSRAIFLVDEGKSEIQVFHLTINVSRGTSNNFFISSLFNFLLLMCHLLLGVAILGLSSSWSPKMLAPPTQKSCRGREERRDEEVMRRTFLTLDVKNAAYLERFKQNLLIHSAPSSNLRPANQAGEIRGANKIK